MRYDGALQGRLAQLGEHQLDKLGVTGSSPVPPTSESPAKRGAFVFQGGDRGRVGRWMGSSSGPQLAVQRICAYATATVLSISADTSANLTCGSTP